LGATQLKHFIGFANKNASWVGLSFQNPFGRQIGIAYKCKKALAAQAVFFPSIPCAILHVALLYFTAGTFFTKQVVSSIAAYFCI
jgi:hypothetical protein